MAIAQHAEGIDLYALERIAPNGRLPPEIALHICVEVAQGLADARQERQRGVAHHNLDMSSVLVSRTGEINLSRILDAQRVQGTVVNALTDVVALGSLLKRLVSGEGGGDDPDSTGGWESRTTFALPGHVQEIFEKATSLDVGVRHPDVRAFAIDCRRVLLGLLPVESRAVFANWLAQLPFPQEPSVPPEADVTAVGVDLLDVATIDRTGGEIPTEIFADPRISNVLAAEHPQQRDPLIGTVVHGYRLVEMLGGGSWSRVYRAEHVHLGYRCAIKVVTGGNEQAHARLLREAKVLSALRHPNLVVVQDCGATDRGVPFMSMELLEGRTLQSVIRDEAPLPIERVKRIARQIAAGLDAAHRVGVVHRDVKPANMMLIGTGEKEVLKILDFGLVRMVDRQAGVELTAKDQIVGTPSYMSPEQIEGAAVGPSSDLYSMGAVIYEMLAGRPPFSADHILAVIDQHLRKAPPPLTGAGRLGELTLLLLAKKPEGRFPSADSFIEAIDSLALSDGAEVHAALGSLIDHNSGIEDTAEAPPNMRSIVQELRAPEPPRAPSVTTAPTLPSPQQQRAPVQFLFGVLAAVAFGVVLLALVFYFR